jgi:hypothetical protein
VRTSTFLLYGSVAAVHGGHHDGAFPSSAQQIQVESFPDPLRWDSIGLFHIITNSCRIILASRITILPPALQISHTPHPDFINMSQHNIEIWFSLAVMECCSNILLSQIRSHILTIFDTLLAVDGKDRLALGDQKCQNRS